MDKQCEFTSWSKQAAIYMIFVALTAAISGE